MRGLRYLYEKCCGDPAPTLEPRVFTDEEAAPPPGPPIQEAPHVIPSRVWAACRPDPKFLYSAIIPAIGAEVLFLGGYVALIKVIYPSSHDESSSSMPTDASDSPPDGLITDPKVGALIGLLIVGSVCSLAGGAKLGAYAYDNRERIFQLPANAIQGVQNTFTALRERLFSASEREPLLPSTVDQDGPSTRI